LDKGPRELQINQRRTRLKSSKDRLFSTANRPLVWLGDAGDRRWRGNRDFSTLRIGGASYRPKGEGLERLSAVVDFARFRGDLERAVVRSDRSRGGRPPFDQVLRFKALILQSRHNLSDERTEYLICDRLSFMRFLGLGLADTVPDANTIWGPRGADAGPDRRPAGNRGSVRAL
jgi:Transposase domain (DUF772)